MNSVLLDTSVIVDFLRRKDKEQSLLYRLAGKKLKLSLSIITHTELYAGKSVWEKRKAGSELETILSGLTLIPLDVSISQLAGQIRARYTINLVDAIIAATAITNKISLATLNTKHFTSIKGLKLYKEEIN